MPISSSWGFLAVMRHTCIIYLQYMYHLLTVNVRTRTEINIPHINFTKKNIGQHHEMSVETVREKKKSL